MPLSVSTVHQINLQPRFGGGEVYTRFMCQALASLGWRTRLLVNPAASFWRGLDLPATDIVPCASDDASIDLIDGRNQLVVAHNVINEPTARRLAERHCLTGFAHMPLYDRNPASFPHYHTIFAVSQYVLDSLRARGLNNGYPLPMYGVADLVGRNATAEQITRQSEFDWDKRKFRDRLLAVGYPFYNAVSPRRRYAKRPGLTLGLVSRLTPIKQFPLLFAHIAPVLARFPGVNLEIFGSGGYASVRDLKHALAPLRGRARFWGQQRDVAGIYRQIDYLLAGLPDKEALGLNVIEAMSCGTPVLAVDAPPFTETVLHGRTGFLFPDPRKDQGEGLTQLLAGIVGNQLRPDPRREAEHLARFSQGAFTLRLQEALAYVSQRYAR